jgi:hypothetical protein
VLFLINWLFIISQCVYIVGIVIKNFLYYGENKGNKTRTKYKLGVITIWNISDRDQ